MDLKAQDFMAKEMLTVDIDTLDHVEKMFVEQAQAGEDVAKEGANLRRGQQRYGIVPEKIPNNNYPTQDVDETTKRLKGIRDW